MFRAIWLLFVLVGCHGGAGDDLLSRPPLRLGRVTVATTRQTVAGRTFAQTHAHALFLDTSESARRCLRRSVGPCTLDRCAPGMGTALLPNAGPLTLGAAEAGVTLAVRGNGSYEAFAHGGGVLWPAPQTLPVRAPGAIVPAFLTEAVLPAPGILLEQPQISPVLSVTIDRSQDLPVSYGAVGTPVRLVLLQDLLSGLGAYLACTFPGGASGGTVPAALLGELSATEGSEHVALLLVGPEAARTIDVAGWSIEIVGIAEGATAQAALR